VKEAEERRLPFLRNYGSDFIIKNTKTIKNVQSVYKTSIIDSRVQCIWLRIFNNSFTQLLLLNFRPWPLTLLISKSADQQFVGVSLGSEQLGKYITCFWDHCCFCSCRLVIVLSLLTVVYTIRTQSLIPWVFQDAWN